MHITQFRKGSCKCIWRTLERLRHVRRVCPRSIPGKAIRKQRKVVLAKHIRMKICTTHVRLSEEMRELWPQSNLDFPTQGLRKSINKGDYKRNVIFHFKRNPTHSSRENLEKISCHVQSIHCKDLLSELNRVRLTVACQFLKQILLLSLIRLYVRLGKCLLNSNG